MGECLRRACPCLQSLWERILTGKKAPQPAGAGGEEEDGGGGRRGTCSDGEQPQAPTPPPKPPKETASEGSCIYTAMWPFESRHQEELSFQEGDLFRVVSRSGDWWTARKIDRNGHVVAQGIVPNNYLARAESINVQP